MRPSRGIGFEAGGDRPEPFIAKPRQSQRCFGSGGDLVEHHALEPGASRAGRWIVEEVQHELAQQRRHVEHSELGQGRLTDRFDVERGHRGVGLGGDLVLDAGRDPGGALGGQDPAGRLGLSTDSTPSPA